MFELYGRSPHSMTATETPEGSRLTAKQLYQRYSASMVAVVTVDKTGDQAIGSAFHIGDGAFVTARHVVDGRSCHIEIDEYLLSTFAANRSTASRLDGDQQYSIEAKVHRDPRKDVAVFSIPVLADLPAIKLGSHLDDLIDDHAFVLNEVLILGYPPIPLAKRNVLVAARAQINAVVDLMTADHVHFIASATARGGFSGGVVLSEWDFALGVVTSSLVKNGAAEELGYLTVLSVEPILECLAQYDLLPKQLAILWDGTFTSRTEGFRHTVKGGEPWIETDRDGHRTRISFAASDEEALAAMGDAMTNIAGIRAYLEESNGHLQKWRLEGDYQALKQPLELARQAVRTILLERGYRPASVAGTGAAANHHIEISDLLVIPAPRKRSSDFGEE